MGNKNQLYDRIEGLIQIKEFDKAIRICNNPLYDNDAMIQYLLMEIYYILKDYNKVVLIGTRDLFQNKINIQLKLVQTYVMTNELDKALAICEKEIFSSHIGFIQFKNKILRKMHTNSITAPEVKQDTLSKECKFLLYIMSLAKQEENYTTKKKLYEEALMLANSEYLKDDPIAIYKKVIILKRLNRFEEAYKIASLSIYDNDENMLVQRVSLLFKLEDYEAAMRVSMDDRISMLDNIIELRKKITEKGEISEDTISDRRKIISNLELIKNNTIDINDLLKYSVTDIYKDILLAAYYEINKYPIGFIKKFINELFQKYSDNVEYTKLINKLRNHLLSDNKIFNNAFYYDLLKEINTNDIRRKRIPNKENA